MRRVQVLPVIVRRRRAISRAALGCTAVRSLPRRANAIVGLLPRLAVALAAQTNARVLDAVGMLDRLRHDVKAVVAELVQVVQIAPAHVHLAVVVIEATVHAPEERNRLLGVEPTQRSLGHDEPLEPMIVVVGYLRQFEGSVVGLIEVAHAASSTDDAEVAARPVELRLKGAHRGSLVLLRHVREVFDVSTRVVARLLIRRLEPRPLLLVEFAVSRVLQRAQPARICCEPRRRVGVIEPEQVVRGANVAAPPSALSISRSLSLTVERILALFGTSLLIPLALLRPVVGVLAPLGALLLVLPALRLPVRLVLALLGAPLLVALAFRLPIRLVLALLGALLALLLPVVGILLTLIIHRLRIRRALLLPVVGILLTLILLRLRIRRLPAVLGSSGRHRLHARPVRAFAPASKRESAASGRDATERRRVDTMERRCALQPSADQRAMGQGAVRQAYSSGRLIECTRPDRSQVATNVACVCWRASAHRQLASWLSSERNLFS